MVTCCVMRQPIRTIGWSAACAVWVLGCGGQVSDGGPGGGQQDIPFDGTFGSTTGGDPGPGVARRLTRPEYTRTITKWLGIDGGKYASALPEDISLAGFDNASALQTMTAGHVAAYQSAAMQVAADVVQNTAQANAVVGCTVATMNDTCLRNFVTRFGRLMFRRSLSADEADALVALAQTESTPQAKVELVVGAILQSPSFLFRFEVGEPAGDDHPNLKKLTGLEMASRLAFLLQGHSPGDELLTDAEQGALDTAEGVEQAAREIIAAGDSKLAFRQFFDQWYRLNKLQTLPTHPAYTGVMTEALSTAAHEEVYRLIDDHAWSTQGSFFNLYTSTYGYLNPDLAAVYDVPASGDTWARHEFAQDSDRGGLFSTAAFLAATSAGGDTSKIPRGVFIRQWVMCQTLQTPPGGANPPEPLPNEPIEETLRRHATDPVCASCHTLIDPLGDGLERYGKIGEFRATYASGSTAVLPGAVHGLPNAEFSGARELGALLAASDPAKDCLVRQMFRWNMGRLEFDQNVNDEPTLATLRGAGQGSDYNFTEMLIAFLKTDAFRYRRDPALDGGTQ
jgi:hypothetical protein